MDEYLICGEDTTFIAEFDTEDFNVADTQTATLSISNHGKVIHHTMDELIIDTDANEIRYEMSQEETLSLVPGVYVHFELTLLSTDKRSCVAKVAAKVVATLLNSKLEVSNA